MTHLALVLPRAFGRPFRNTALPPFKFGTLKFWIKTSPASAYAEMKFAGQPHRFSDSLMPGANGAEGPAIAFAIAKVNRIRRDVLHRPMLGDA
jgi:hypothetical protein